VLFSVLIATALYTGSSASSHNKGADAGRSDKGAIQREVTKERSRSLETRWLAPLSPLAPLVPDTLATYEVNAGACTNTLKDSFLLGEEVCVKASADLSGRRLSIDGTDGTVAAITDVTTDPQELVFTLPSTTTSVVNGFVVDNRGIWRATVRSSGDFGSRATAFFSVTDPANAAADLVVFADSTAVDNTVAPGDPTSFLVYLRNDGPNPAAAVHVTQNVPANMTFDSATAVSGPAFTCTESGGIVDCTPTGNLASGAISSFTLNYTVSAGAPNAIVTTEVDVNSDTTDPHPTSNSAIARLEIRAAGSSGATCALACPLNRTVGANTTQSGQPGAFVNFASDIESSGDCGTVTSSPASGSFFSVAGSPHTVMVSSATGGGSCSFTITVTEDPAPTITCAADQNATTSGSSNEATVTVNTPTATGNNVQVTGVRNDNRSLSDPYPVGTTTITWTARECNNPPDCDDPNARFASCTQRIIVTSPDVPTISCPSPKTFPADDCAGKTLTAGQIGTPTATGSNVTITSQRSDGLDLTGDPYPVGTTAVTWSATDDAGRVASCTQTITITSSNADNVPPTLHVPPDVSATTSSCTATLDDELGVASAEDNCGNVSISRTGVPTFACPTPTDPNRRCESFVFPTGTTIVTYTATDNAGNVTTGTQRVVVTESPAINPTITAPADVTVNTGAGATSCGAVVSDATLGSASASDNCPGVTVSRSPAGNNFPVGNTTVTYTATDASGNTATDTQIVTVVDNTPPTITAPADSSANADASCQAAVPDYRPSTTAADNCGSVTLSQSPAPGTLVGFGPHTVTITATDSHNNTSSDDVVFTVNDVTPPTITAPADSSAFADSVCLSPVPDYRPGTVAADNCGSVTLSQTPAPGTLVGYGPHTITVTANDGHGNTASDTVVFTVNDNTPPVFTSCPTSSTIEPTCPTGAIATYPTPTATDNCGVTVTRTAGPASGSVFPIGTTTVTHVADDGHGNTATCTFTVTVLTPQAVIQNLIASVNASSLNGPQKNGLLSKLNAALSGINSGQQNQACAKLSDFINSVGNLVSGGSLPAATGNAWTSSANHVRNTIGCTSLPCS